APARADRGSRRGDGRAAPARPPGRGCPRRRRAGRSPQVAVSCRTRRDPRRRGGRPRPAGVADSGRPLAPPPKPPIQPQLALSRKVLPEGEDWVYEPKYDGFRALAFVDGDDVYLQSRGGKPLRRYFPEVEFPKGRYVLDGELVILDDDGREE